MSGAFSPNADEIVVFLVSLANHFLEVDWAQMSPAKRTQQVPVVAPAIVDLLLDALGVEQVLTTAVDLGELLALDHVTGAETAHLVGWDEDTLELFGQVVEKVELHFAVDDFLALPHLHLLLGLERDHLIPDSVGKHVLDVLPLTLQNIELLSLNAQASRLCLTLKIPPPGFVFVDRIEALLTYLKFSLPPYIFLCILALLLDLALLCFTEEETTKVYVLFSMLWQEVVANHVLLVVTGDGRPLPLILWHVPIATRETAVAAAVDEDDKANFEPQEHWELETRHH